MFKKGLGTKIVLQHFAGTKLLNPCLQSGDSCPSRERIVLKIPQVLPAVPSPTLGTWGVPSMGRWDPGQQGCPNLPLPWVLL